MAKRVSEVSLREAVSEMVVEDLTGRDLDAAVALEFFDLRAGVDQYGTWWVSDPSRNNRNPWAFEFRHTDGDRGGTPKELPYFHRHIDPAWDILLALREMGMETSAAPLVPDGGGCVVNYPTGGRIEARPPFVHEEADTPETAICRAGIRVRRMWADEAWEVEVPKERGHN